MMALYTIKRSRWVKIMYCSKFTLDTKRYLDPISSIQIQHINHASVENRIYIILLRLNKNMFFFRGSVSEIGSNTLSVVEKLNIHSPPDFIEFNTKLSRYSLLPFSSLELI